MAATVTLTGLLPCAASAQSTDHPSTIVVTFEHLPNGVNAARVRRAIADELHVRVVSDARARDDHGARLTVSFDYDGNLHELYRDASGREVDRTIAAPGSPRELLRAIAWLAGNLARHEADELLAALPAPQTDASASPPARELEPSPAPTLATQDLPPSTAPRSAPPAVPVRASSAPPTPEPFRILVSLFPPVSTDGAAIGTRPHAIGIAALASSARSLTGFDLASAFTFTRESAQGAQIAGLANVVGRGVYGVQLAGIANVSGGDTRGLQIAAVNAVHGDLVGAQLAGIVNATGRHATGLLVAGLNFVEGSATGVQWAGLANAARALDGWQLGAVNVVRSHARGAQMGVYQHADTMTGLQLGAVNYARDLRGVQVGVVNVVTRGSGTSIGIVSVAPGQPVHVEVTGGTLPAFGLALRHGTRYVRNVYAFSVAPFSQGVVWMPGWGLGAHIPGHRIEFDIDTVVHWIQRGATFSLAPNLLTQFRVNATIVVAPRFGVILGAALNWMFTVDAANADLVLGPRVVIPDATSSPQHFVWPSLHVGIRI